MVSEHQCPDDQSLRQLIDGHTGEDQSAELAEHVEHCEQCQARIESWLDSQFVVNTPDQSTDDKVVDELVASLQKTPPARKSASLLSLAPGDCLDDYQIIESIGCGTTGMVYRADDIRLSRQVALKILRSDLASSDRARQRLEREAKATASLRNENVVAIYDVKIDPGGTSYLVMELVVGGTVKDLIRKEFTVYSRRAAEITMQMASALASAHSRGLIHRDLKSANVLIDSKSGSAKLTDFGLVRDLDSDSNLTRENIVAGTPAYMSPEQIRNPHDVDGRADIYSLGIVLYEMLSGELPFRGIDRMILTQVLKDEARSLRRLNDRVDRDLETICSKMMSKSPDDRYESATELHSDLLLYLSGDPIKARPIGSLSRVRRWCYRHKAIAALVGLSATLLLVVTIGSIIAALKMRAASLEADRHAVVAAVQRDRSLETLRKIVFEVNELLEPDEDIDLDEVQRKLLLVALEGFQQQVALNAGEEDLPNASFIAAKNRLADVLYRLDRLEQARLHFSQALADADKLISQRIDPDDSDANIVATERHRSLEGLSMIAYERGDEERAEKLLAQADEAATMLSHDVTDPQSSDLFNQIDQLLSEGKPKRAAEMMVQSLPENEVLAVTDGSSQQLDWIALLVDELGSVLLEYDDVAISREVYTRFLEWLDVGNKEKPFLDNTTGASETHPDDGFSDTIQFAKHLCHFGIAQSWLVEGQISQFVASMRKSVDVLPRNPDEPSQLDWSVYHVGHDTIKSLFDEIDLSEPKDWMLVLAKMDLETTNRIVSEGQSSKSMVADQLFAHSRVIQLLVAFDRIPEATESFKSMKEIVEADDLKLPKRRRSMWADEWMLLQSLELD